MQQDTSTAVAPSHPPKLKELAATAICGNDITSSCLYVSALAIIYAGQYAWVALLMVGGVLFLFRSIYGEVVGALPLNGGAYNALLNTTSKSTASLAACLTLLSYMATAVISASEAMHYVHHFWQGLPILYATIGLLALFMGLTIMGIGESSIVAIIIFITHISTLTLLVLVGFFYLFSQGFGTLALNYSQPLEGSIWKALFFGFAAAMLGISGFESSANFVEEQAPGVFPKTLRNMWLAVTIFNPLTAFLAVAIIPIAASVENQTALLAYLGEVAGGSWLAVLISVDAALVLSGAVLTSYVGMTGLVQRMTLDRCLPQFLLKMNKRGSAYLIMISFFLLCVSILFITRGDIGALAGVYTISFLSVMALFGLGNILLKFRRNRLPRPVRASALVLFVAISAVLAALAGNAILNPAYVWVFLEYFIPTVAVVFIMLYRIELLIFVAYLLRQIEQQLNKRLPFTSRKVIRLIHRIRSQQFVFFTRGDNIANINKVMRYIVENEHTNRIKIVNVLKEGEAPPKKLMHEVEVLDLAYPELEVDFVILRGHFGPKLVQELSNKWGIPKNFMFIGSPGDRFPYGLQEMGGVRLVI
ncbi:amino acid/polyamine/organocation transporter (APC superfamily) [Pontibacter mucosus]|uniref:Amino acid/polyamine/organocation transporter (APC superfamily) n=1 Tax=Pontibacter mucosus TaxID=1649266 RepID=A0A2T5YG32_9BACT|nr:APC family permease [Pontibacter mucosus]PTX18241.1 amino acid/polyamine/organocation transporter (APC superfamily) [Pontibacter mucosus]